MTKTQLNGGLMYDAIIVGARIAGAGTALQLAQAGRRVLLLDRMQTPSIRRAATNVVHPRGVWLLQEWGLLEAVIDSADAAIITRYGLKVGAADMVGAPPEFRGVDYALAPRRETLDDLLVDAAVEAGAELRENANVQRVIRDGDGTVTGVVGRYKGGEEFIEHGRIVIGADGANSRVAAMVGAEKTVDLPVLNKSYFSWWKGIPRDDVVRTYRVDRAHLAVWSTHDDLTLVVLAEPTSDFRQRDDLSIDARVAELIAETAPDIAESMSTAERAGQWMLGSVANFVRRAQGPGWALVGDAGYCRDPITGSGITDALWTSRILATSLTRTGDDLIQASVDYERLRDQHVLGHFAYTCDFAELRPHTQEEWALIDAMSRSPRHASGMVGVFSGVITPSEFYNRNNFRDLFDHLGGTRAIGVKMRIVDLLTRKIPGGPGWVRRLGDALIAQNLGPMGPYFLDRHPGNDSREARAGELTAI